MTNRRNRTIDRFSGPATLFEEAQEHRGTVTYTVLHEQLEAMPGEWVDGLMSWSGSFSLEGSPYIKLSGEELTLRIPDGRAGRILVTRQTIGEAVVAFVGNGAQPS